jgi:hypothetical protein
VFWSKSLSTLILLTNWENPVPWLAIIGFDPEQRLVIFLCAKSRLVPRSNELPGQLTQVLLCLELKRSNRKTNIFNPFSGCFMVLLKTLFQEHRLYGIQCDDSYEWLSRAIAQAVSRRLPTAAARVRFQVKSCGICGEKGGTGAGVLLVLRFPLTIFIPLNSPYSSIIYGWYNRPITGRRTKWTQYNPPPNKTRGGGKCKWLNAKEAILTCFNSFFKYFTRSFVEGSEEIYENLRYELSAPERHLASKGCWQLDGDAWQSEESAQT